MIDTKYIQPTTPAGIIYNGGDPRTGSTSVMIISSVATFAYGNTFALADPGDPPL